MENTKWIKYMSSSEFDEKRKTCDTVIIPVGATEVYGPHLPMGSDILVAQAVAEKVADQVNAMIGPSLEVGESYSLSKYPGTLYLRPETWKSVVEDFMVSLMKWGFKKFMFINGHAGNVPIIGQLVRPMERDLGIKVAQVDWWRFTQKHALGVCDTEGWMCHGHASECGTSVMLYLYPELVDHDEITCVKNIPNNYPDVLQYSHFTEKTPNGSIGDSTVATIEKGKAIVEACVDRIMDYLKNAF